MILYFLVEPIGFDHTITEKLMHAASTAFEVLPVIGYTDSPTLNIPGIFQLPTVDKDYGYDYEAFFESVVDYRIDYNIETYERYGDEERKSIWPHLREINDRSMMTCGTLDMLLGYIQMVEDENIDINIIPILLLQESNKCIDNFFYYYHGHNVSPADIYKMLSDTDYDYDSIFTKKNLILHAMYDDTEGSIYTCANKFLHILDQVYKSDISSILNEYAASAGIIKENVTKYFREG